MGCAAILLWTLWSLSSISVGKVGGAVVASKGSGKALGLSQIFQGHYLEEVVKEKSGENCSTLELSPRVQHTQQGFEKSGRASSSFDYDILDLPILQSSFASECFSLFSMLETLEASANDEQVEKPQCTSQRQQQIQAVDTKTKFDFRSTRRGGDWREGRVVLGQSSMGDFIAPCKSESLGSYRATSGPHDGRSSSSWIQCGEDSCNVRSKRSGSAHTIQAPQQGDGKPSRGNGGTTELVGGQDGQDIDAWPYQQVGKASAAVGYLEHQNFRDGPQLESVHGESDAEIWTSSANVPTVPRKALQEYLQKSQEIQAAKEQVQSASVAMLQTPMAEPPATVGSLDAEALFEGAVQDDAYMNMEEDGEEDQGPEAELVRDKQRPAIAPFRRTKPISASPTKVHAVHLKK